MPWDVKIWEVLKIISIPGWLITLGFLCGDKYYNPPQKVKHYVEVTMDGYTYGLYRDGNWRVYDVEGKPHDIPEAMQIELDYKWLLYVERMSGRIPNNEL